MSTVADHIDALTPSTQVHITHTAYTGVSAGSKQGWVGTITSTTVQIRSQPGQGGSIVATVPKANITAVAGAPGWRNLG